MAIRIDVGSTELVKVAPASGKEFSLQELHEVVDGYIEIVYHGAFLPRGMVMVVNETGWVTNPPLPYNKLASLIAGQPIAGNALICEFGREIS